MSESKTPETDAVELEAWKLRKHARKLERQRDDLIELIESVLDCAIWDGYAATKACVEDRLQEIKEAKQWQDSTTGVDLRGFGTQCRGRGGEMTDIQKLAYVAQSMYAEVLKMLGEGCPEPEITIKVMDRNGPIVAVSAAAIQYSGLCMRWTMTELQAIADSRDRRAMSRFWRAQVDLLVGRHKDKIRQLEEEEESE